MITYIYTSSFYLDAKNSQETYFQISATASVHNAIYEESSLITSPSAKVKKICACMLIFN